MNTFPHYEEDWLLNSGYQYAIEELSCRQRIREARRSVYTCTHEDTRGETGRCASGLTGDGGPDAGTGRRGGRGLLRAWKAVAEAGPRGERSRDLLRLPAGGLATAGGEPPGFGMKDHRSLPHSYP